MSRVLSCLAVVSCLAPAVSSAVPLELPHQGRVTDSAGAPINGDLTLIFDLWDAQSGGESDWTETHTLVPVRDGYYAVTLGSITDLGPAILDGGPHWLSVSTNDVELGSRTPVLSVPYAVRADVADAVPTDVLACTAAGQVRYAGGTLEVCDGLDWQTLQTAKTLGRSETQPAASCAAILADDPGAATDVYWINPGGTALQVQCNMRIAGGGWTLVAAVADDGNDYWTRGNWPDLLTDNSVGQLETAYTNDFKSPAWGRLTGEDVLISKSLNGDWLLYDTILSGDALSSQYTSTAVQLGEHSVKTTSGSWWFQCSNLNLRLQAEDSDPNDNISKGFVFRSTNNNGCSYDDALGGPHISGTSTTTEDAWVNTGFYHQNFDGGAALIWVR